MLSEQDCQKAAQSIAAALPVGRTLFIVGHVTDDNFLAPKATVGMIVTFLNIFDDGQAYSEVQYRNWLENAGFKSIVRSLFVAGNSLISARKI